MAPFIFGARNGIHIIDLDQTVPTAAPGAVEAFREVARRRAGPVRRHQAPGAGPVAEAAKRCGQYYVNHRWLGGMLTNWRTISASIKRPEELDEASSRRRRLHQEGAAQPSREREKLERALGGIKEMGGLPDIMFVIDTNKEAIAVQEANKLNIPVVGHPRHQLDPGRNQLPDPGQRRREPRHPMSTCDLAAAAVLDGIQAEMLASGVDIGAQPRAGRGAAGRRGRRRRRRARPRTGKRSRPPAGPPAEAPAEEAAQGPDRTTGRASP